MIKLKVIILPIRSEQREKEKKSFERVPTMPVFPHTQPLPGTLNVE
jgi:hypothetical protein